MADSDGPMSLEEAKMWQDGGSFSPVVDNGFVHAGGETHILNYDTNILSLDDTKEPTGINDDDFDGDFQDPSSYSGTGEEEEDIEVTIMTNCV